MTSPADLKSSDDPVLSIAQEFDETLHILERVLNKVLRSGCTSLVHIQAGAALLPLLESELESLKAVLASSAGSGAKYRSLRANLDQVTTEVEQMRSKLTRLRNAVIEGSSKSPSQEPLPP